MDRNIVSHSLVNWLPFRLVNTADGLLCSWLYTGNLAYNVPFFGDIKMVCNQYAENIQPQKSYSALDTIPEWAKYIDSVYPTAIIFHVSRCGSTLVSQALGLLNDSISISEVPVFDQLLRLPLIGYDGSEQQVNEYLAGAVRFYGARRLGNENKFFIKTDSWHLVYYQQYRAIYPEVPFIILYREPGEVLESNSRKKGVQGIVNVTGPEVYGFEMQPENYPHPDLYMGYVLQKYFHCIMDIAGTDKNVLLLNYNQGLEILMQKIATFTGIAVSQREQALIKERGLYDAKHPGVRFVEQNGGVVEHALLSNLKELYGEIEK